MTTFELNAAMQTKLAQAGIPHETIKVFGATKNSSGVLILIRGLPGSGKTTLASALEGYEHHEADQYFERGGAYLFDSSKLQKAHASCLAKARSSISRGACCVVSNIFTQRWEMQPYIVAAKMAGVAVYVLEARGAWKNVHGVTDDAIEWMGSRWERI